ncbi:transposase zinc-binding domain-containing protein [Candidatus Woesearchaeota archaeon]|nr:transposase zinc-binding domain-containing protein [Candidatus Woesearchaeota archaeon]
MKNKQVTVKSIFQQYWPSFLNEHKDKLRKIEIIEVKKMLNCNKRGCNSRICNSCGKRYTDNWSENLKTFDLPHKHITLTLSDLLWLDK